MADGAVGLSKKNGQQADSADGCEEQVILTAIQTFPSMVRFQECNIQEIVVYLAILQF